MMRWCRKYRPPREVEPYLGDIPDGLEPPRPRSQQSATRNRQARREETNRLHGFLAIIAMLVLGTVGLLVVFALLSIAKAQSQSQQIKIPPACAKLAALFGATVPEYFSRIEAEAALAQMNLRMVLVPEARACRSAIKMELKK